MKCNVAGLLAHSLEGAQALAKEFLAKREEWHIIFED